MTDRDTDKDNVILEVDPGETLHIRVRGRKPKPPKPPDPEPPPVNKWPNEPAGLTTLVEDWPMLDNPIPPGPAIPPGIGYEDVPLTEGYRIIYNHAPGSHWPDDPIYEPFSGTPVGWCQHDPIEKAMQFVYAKGMRMGTGPSTVYRVVGPATTDPGAGYRRMYSAFWWKPSDPIDLGGLGQKIAFMFNGGGGAGGQCILGLGADHTLWALPEYPDYYNSGHYYMMPSNINATVVTLAQWHLLEWYMNVTTGEIRWWMDGLLQGDHLGATNEYAFDMFQFAPTFGGNGDTYKTAEDYYWYRNHHLSVGTVAPARSMAELGLGPAAWASPAPTDLFGKGRV